MTVSETPIPIVILHRNEFEGLRLMLDSIRANTQYPYELYLIDNHSSRYDAAEQLNDIVTKYDICLMQSKRNNWVLGFNLVFDHPSWKGDHEFMCFSDADIIVPKVDMQGKCWLELMVDEMRSNVCIGKLGLSLCTEDIDHPFMREKIQASERKIMSGPRLGSNIVAPVDTTLALYRPNFFVGANFRFSVGHASLARPYYYTCRTNYSLRGKHLGWYEEHILKLNSAELEEKVHCFAKYCGYVDAEILKHCSSRSRLRHFFISRIAFVVWGARILGINALYLIKRFPRSINEIQAGCR